ncbi:AAA family ATPase [Mycobacterium sp.]|uniref:bifunctional aminoglycoside phosphotransferase/ATP-binding protein n=1 Tax=Mycobacterium sp. TaxID=1785 RepID=UPI002C30795D|nr:AAA family ATPase [Mycobacterium sp.]HKP44015.1 AAA family ATPase [Mycobacterium sp.]
MGNLDAQVHETHTGVVVLIGDKAYKAKKPIVTDFLDFSTADRRERACNHEVALNRRLAPDSYLGVAHFSDPGSGASEPVIVMRRYPDATRLASMVRAREPVRHHLCVIAERLARFHADAKRSHVIDTHASVGAVAARWQENLEELARYKSVAPREPLREIARLTSQFGRGRAALFAQRIADRRIVDGHGDLLADDIFCVPHGPALLDCLEFDDHLRYVDGIDDAAFLAMDLEFLGRKDLADHFLDEYCRRADDAAPKSLKDFYIAYRAVVRAKVDCIRVAQGHADAAADARKHIDIALDHLRAGAVRLIIIGGGPGSGKTTLARSLAEQVGAQVISTDDVRKELQHAGAIAGEAGELNAGLYTPENISQVYDEVLRRAQVMLSDGSSVILDGTWRDSRQRKRARHLADQTDAPLVEFSCSVAQQEASARIRGRGPSASDATPEIAAALADAASFDGHHIDTGRPLAESVAEAQQICCLAI